MQHELHNSWHATEAAWRRRGDLSLRFVAAWGRPGPTLHPISPGYLMLRRWSGRQHPMPTAPAMVAYRRRPASKITHNMGAFPVDGVHWHRVDLVSPAGVWRATLADQARSAVVQSSQVVGALPAPPMWLRSRVIAGGKMLLQWLYERADEQATPAEFRVYSDGGTGTIDLVTPAATIPYVRGLRHYEWTSGALTPGTTHAFVARARTAGGVESLLPESGSYFGTGDSFALLSVQRAPRNYVVVATIAAPPAPEFS